MSLSKLSCKTHAKKVLEVLSKTSTALSTPNNGHVLYLSGEELQQRPYTDRDLPFRQESNFYYLTGCSIPSAKLVLNGTPASFKSTLFIPPLHPDEVMWMGLPPTPEEVLKSHDVHEVKTTNELDAHLKQLVSAETSSVLTLPQVKLDGYKTVSDDTLIDAIEEARLIKTDSEIERIQRANEISSKAHEELMRRIMSVKTEYEANAIFEYTCKSNGAQFQAYESIMASGPSSATLHYVDNRKLLPTTTALMLVDAGCEYDMYAADITRTFPLHGPFSKEAKSIYNLVFEMQQKAFSCIKAGASWEAIQLEMHRMVIRGLLANGVLVAGPSKATGEDLVEELYQKDLSAAFFPHGLGHNLGLDVHDVPRKASRPEGPSSDPKLRYLRIRRSLLENQVVTVEPGCYFNPFLLEPVKDSPYVDHDLVKEYIKIGGVRIEDNVVVTKDGYRNLTTATPSLQEIEKLVTTHA